MSNALRLKSFCRRWLSAMEPKLMAGRELYSGIVVLLGQARHPRVTRCIRWWVTCGGFFFFFFLFSNFVLVQRHRLKAARSSIWFGIKDQND